MNWKTHVKLMLHKLGNACFVVRNKKYCSNIETLEITHHTYFHSVMKYGIIFWGYSPDAQEVFNNYCYVCHSKLMLYILPCCLCFFILWL
jgi:hypothetical protein